MSGSTPPTSRSARAGASSRSPPKLPWPPTPRGAARSSARASARPKSRLSGPGSCARCAPGAWAGFGRSSATPKPASRPPSSASSSRPGCPRPVLAADCPLYSLPPSADRRELPRQHRTRLHGTNPVERRNKEVKRRADGVGIFPTEASILRLIRAVHFEQKDVCGPPPLCKGFLGRQRHRCLRSWIRPVGAATRPLVLMVSAVRHRGPGRSTWRDRDRWF